MSRSSLIILLGFFVLVWPFLGVPRELGTWILPSIGGAILVVEIYSWAVERIRARLEERKNSKS